MKFPHRQEDRLQGLGCRVQLDQNNNKLYQSKVTCPNFELVKRNVKIVFSHQSSAIRLKLKCLMTES